MEAVHFSETSVNFHRAKRRHISEDSILYGHRHDILNPNIEKNISIMRGTK
jgi:hypothetical protein